MKKPKIVTVALGEDVYGGSYNIDGTKKNTFSKLILSAAAC